MKPMENKPFITMRKLYHYKHGWVGDFQSVSDAEKIMDEMGGVFHWDEPFTDTTDGKPSEAQEGGDHYKRYAIQPTEFIHKNGLNFIQGNVIKYIMRYKDKNGLEDLKKAKHYVELLMEYEYGN